MLTFDDLLIYKKEKGTPVILWDLQGSMLYIHFAPLIDMWIECTYLTENKILSKNTVRGYFKNIPGYVSHRYSKRIHGKVYRCVVFYKKRTPKPLLEIINYSKQKGEL